MQTIGLSEAETRLRELLDRTARGETFEIIKNGHSVGKLVPPDSVRNQAAIKAAVEGLLGMAGMGGKMSPAERKALVHEGHRV